MTNTSVQAEATTSVSTAIPPDVGAMSFEDALGELERIVRSLEEGRGRLDESISAYERGMALRRHCEAKLREARAKVERITVSADGALSADPMPVE